MPLVLATVEKERSRRPNFLNSLFKSFLAIPSYFSKRIPKKNTSFVAPIITSKGNEKLIEFHCMKNKINGSNNYAYCMLKDSTEYYESFMKNKLFSDVLEKSDETIIITDKQGTILYANPTFKKTTGYEVKNVIGKNLRC